MTSISHPLKRPVQRKLSKPWREDFWSEDVERRIEKIMVRLGFCRPDKVYIPVAVSYVKAASKREWAPQILDDRLKGRRRSVAFSDGRFVERSFMATGEAAENYEQRQETASKERLEGSVAPRW